MKVSCVWAIGIGLVSFGAGARTLAHAEGLDAPQKIHHTRTAESRLSEAHRAPAHHAASTATHNSARTATAHSSALHTGAHGANGAHLRRVAGHVHHLRYYGHYGHYASSILQGPVGEGDITAGEDPVIRQAAIDALGDLNGTAVVIDPSNGRILAMVNQKLALSPGAEPCSTIKLTVALAALSEGLVTRDTMVRLDGFRMNMTQALAHSNNLYFEELGRELGFDRVHHYATEFGLGELAGYNIAGEQLGQYPDQAIPAEEGGVGRMCSFGQGVSLTPLQLGAFVSAMANGGTLYYLQHPTTPEEVSSFQPRIKRTLGIARYVPDVVDGMAGAVEYGTARRLRINFQQFPVFGKTGTCSNDGTHLGWFVSYSDSPQGSLVTVFFLEGGRDVFGPRAAELTGEFYRNLWDHNYFELRNQEAKSDSTTSPAGASQ
jgi:penicillin-binding protein 2